MEKPDISRRDFLKLSGLHLGALVLPVDTIDNLVKPSPEKNPERLKAETIVALKAAQSAREFFEGREYTYGKADCAIFAGQFATYFGIPLIRNNDSASIYKPDAADYLPHATTVKQVPWFNTMNNSLGGGCTMELETKKLAQEGFWATVSPGSLVYLKTQGESQHGYDQYSHVAAFLGHDEYQKPIFGEYSPAMKKGPEIDRSLEQVLKMYHGNLPSLTTTIVDVPKIAAEMWKRKLEAVVPNSKALIEAGYTSFLTININNGLATNWEVNKEGQPEPREFADGSKELYCVVGRNLLSKIGLTEKYNTLIEKISSFDKYANLKHSSYDSTNAILRGTPLDVPRYCLTPPLMFEVSDFSLVGNFGHLGGSTDIAIMQVLEEKDGKVVKVDEISNYTIHATPQGTDSQQDLLLRDELLNEANKVGKPLPPNKVHLTSGCANFTPEVFKIIKRSLLHDKNKKTAVIFSYPDFPQDTQLNNGAFTYARDPLGGSLNRLWDYTEL